MQWSYWELKNWLKNIDYTIIGSGIVGLNCALELRKLHPHASILIIEKGILPEGASTKNAGFACFGSITELQSDIEKNGEEYVFDLVLRRWQGLELLKQSIGTSNMKFEKNGGYELFNNSNLFEKAQDSQTAINNLLFPIFKTNVFKRVTNTFGFQNIHEQLFYNPLEGQIDTGEMMQSLLQNVHTKNIKILNSVCFEKYQINGSDISVKTDRFEFKTNHLLFASNGFFNSNLNHKVQPARAQVLITDPIPNLDIKGTFHLEEGFYYFRNIDNRILLGGGRNLALQEETTTQLGTTSIIQNKLNELLRTQILPNKKYTVANRWSCIMGVGDSKSPIVQRIGDNVYCGVRLGGMGVALGSKVGQDLAQLTI